jgi:hypothetical protein
LVVTKGILESVFCFLRSPYAVKCKSFWWGEEQLHRSPKSFWWGEEQLHRSPKSFWWGEEQLHRSPKSFWWGEEQLHRSPKSFWWEEERLYRSPKPLDDNLSSTKNEFFVCDESLRSISCILENYKICGVWVT